MDLTEIIEKIVELEQEREDIFQDSHVTPEEHPRLAYIEAELPKLWDLRRRLEAAKAAGLNTMPVPPPADLDDVAVCAGLVDRDLGERVFVTAHLSRPVYREGGADARRPVTRPEDPDQAGVAATGAVGSGPDAHLGRRAEIRRRELGS